MEGHEAKKEGTQGAIEAYDSRGEATMLGHPAECGAPVVLPDGRTTAGGDREREYISTGEDREIKGVQPVGNGLDGLFYGWPSRESLWQAAMVKIASGCRAGEPDYGDDPPINYGESVDVAPSLPGAIGRAIEVYDMPDSLLRMIDQEVAQVAEAIAEAIPPEEADALRRRIKASDEAGQ